MFWILYPTVDKFNPLSFKRNDNTQVGFMTSDKILKILYAVMILMNITVLCLLNIWQYE